MNSATLERITGERLYAKTCGDSEKNSCKHYSTYAKFHLQFIYLYKLCNNVQCVVRYSGKQERKNFYH